MSKLVIFDGNAIMHRAYHAMPPMRTTSGDPISAVYGLTSMLLRVVEDLKPSHLAFAFDRPEPTFRKKLLEAYQSHRPEMAEDLGGQFEKAYEVLQAMGIPVYDKAGYEADDVIGTIAKMATTHVIASKTKQSSMKKDRHAVARDDNSVGEVVVVTGDRDMLQLVNDKTKLYMSERGLGKAKLYGDNETKERMGVAPERIVDLKGLMGDSSDNYKGVPGVGPKTAMNLLDKY